MDKVPILYEELTEQGHYQCYWWNASPPLKETLEGEMSMEIPAAAMASIVALIEGAL